MFAFALWDEARRELVLARDRFGKKPLYYAQRRPIARSSARSSRRCSSIRAAPRSSTSTRLSRYLALEYVPTPRSIFAGVRKLPGGPRPALARRPGRRSSGTGISSLRARRPSRRPTTSTPRSFRERLREAVRRRLISDVPLGAFLSGGIDSSSVVAMMVEAMPSRRRQDVLDRLRRAELRRVGARAARRGALRHRPPRGGLHARASCSTCCRRSSTSSTSRSPTRRSCRPTCSRGSRASP